MVANLDRGGQQRMALLLAGSLSCTHNVSFLVFSDTTLYGHYRVPENIHFYNINITARPGRISKLRNVILRAHKVRKIKKDNHIEAAISFGESANIINCLSKRNEKIITSIRSSNVLENGITFLDKLTFSLSDKTVFISKGQKTAYAEQAKRYAKKMRVIYNACDYEYVSKLASQNVDLNVDYNTFVAVGRIVDVKCFRNLINSFKLASEKYHDLKLFIIGDGDLASELKKYVVETEMDECVKFLGDRDNPFAYVSKARALLNSSGSESFSNVVLEALACGTPVIATDCKFGPREILSDNCEYGTLTNFAICEYGILCPSFDVHKEKQVEEEHIFSEAILYFLNHDELEKEYRCKSIQRIQAFSVNKYLADWNCVLTEK